MGPRPTARYHAQDVPEFTRFLLITVTRRRKNRMKSHALKSFDSQRILGSLSPELNFCRDNFYHDWIERHFVARIQTFSLVRCSRFAGGNLRNFLRTTQTQQSFSVMRQNKSRHQQKQIPKDLEERKYMHPPSARGSSIYDILHRPDRTKRGKKNGKRKKKNRVVHVAKAKKEPRRPMSTIFLSRARYVPKRPLIIPIMGTTESEVEGTFVRVSRRMHFCPGRERPRMRDKV